MLHKKKQSFSTGKYMEAKYLYALKIKSLASKYPEVQMKSTH